MTNKMNIEELKSMIASKIKDAGLDGILDNSAIEKIKDRVMSVYNHEKAKSQVPDMIPEATIPNGLGTSETGIFPNSGFGTGESQEANSLGDVTSIEKVSLPSDYTQQPGQNVDAGTTGNIPTYKPTMPAFLEKIDPAKIVIFSQNELSESGENLSNKPLRTFENPDQKKSMHEFWMENGQKKAEVYMAKLEKIGELEFDYANGTTKFVEKRFEPDFEAQAKYKENPYMPTGPATPGELDINGQPNVLNQLSNAVDLEKVAYEVVKDLLKDKLLNQTKAVNDRPYALGALDPNNPNQKTDNKGYYIDESSLGYDTTQAVKPMEEGFSLKMIDLVNNYEKIDTPSKLKEAIEKNSREFLIKENDEVQEWSIDGKSFYMPVNKISTRKCYIKS